MSVVVFMKIIIIYPLTARVVGALQMISQPVSSIFPCPPLPSRPVHSLMLSSHLFLCLPCLLPPFKIDTIILITPTTTKSRSTLFKKKVLSFALFDSNKQLRHRRRVQRELVSLAEWQGAREAPSRAVSTVLQRKGPV